MVAEKLCERLRDHLLQPESLFSETRTSGSASSPLPAPSQERPVLLLLDRNVDLGVMLHHPWTYQPLIHDLLGIHKNRVRVTMEVIGLKTLSGRVGVYIYIYMCVCVCVCVCD